MNIQFCCHLCCSSSVMFRHNPLNVRRSLSLRFGFRPQFLSADEVFPWSVYTVITLRTATLDTANEVAVWLQMLQLKTRTNSLSSLEIWWVSHCAVLSHKLSLNTTCNALTLALHSVNTQNNDEGYSQLMFFQCSQHKHFHTYTVQCFHHFVHHLHILTSLHCILNAFQDVLWRSSDFT